MKDLQTTKQLNTLIVVFLVAFLLMVALTGCARGNQGKIGVHGTNALTAIYPADKEVCEYGGVLIAAGQDYNVSWDLQIEEVQYVAPVCNGAPGQDALPTEFTPVAIIDPCGNTPNVVDEVFLQLANGTILASFSDNLSGKNTHFSTLTEGNYVTTDGTNCQFSIDANGQMVQ